MRYFSTNTVFPLEYVSCGNLISKQEFLHPRRTLDTFVLILVKEGVLYISKAGTDYELHQNQYVFLNPYEEHYGFLPSPGKLSYLWVHFLPQGEVTIRSDDLFLGELFKEKDTLLNDLYIMPEYGDISLVKKVPLLFNQLLDFSRNEQNYSSKITNYAMSLLVMEIFQEFLDKYNKEKQSIPPSVNLIMEWVGGHYLEPLTVTSIADEFGYNADYLSAMFKKFTDYSLTQFINKTRVNISKSLIANYNIPIKEAAYSCGFADEKYYMKVFKKIENMTPSQYKEAFIHKKIN